MFKIYKSLKKKLKEARFYSAENESDEACPTWQPENMFEKLKCVSFILPCEVFLVSTVLLSHTELKNLMNIIATEEIGFLGRKRLEKNHIS